MQRLAKSTGWRAPSARRLVMWGAIAALLLFPAIAMRFTAQVAWTGADFAAAAALLIGAGVIYEIAARNLDARHRTVIGLAIVGVVLLIWAEGAVGLFH